MMLTRRRGIIYISFAAFFLLALLALIFSTRRYKSVGEIELQKDSTSSLVHSNRSWRCPLGCARSQHDYPDPGEDPAVRLARPAT